jgi:hypothetical protein
MHRASTLHTMGYVCAYQISIAYNGHRIVNFWCPYCLIIEIYFSYLLIFTSVFMESFLFSRVFYIALHTRILQWV